MTSGLPWRTMPAALLLTGLLTACPQIPDPGEPPGPDDPGVDTGFPDPNAGPANRTGEILTFADYYGVHVVDLVEGTDSRINGSVGARVYLDDRASRVLSSTSGEGLASEVATLDGTLVERFDGAAMGWVGTERVAIAEVFAEDLSLGPVTVYWLDDVKEDIVFHDDRRHLVWDDQSTGGGLLAFVEQWDLRHFIHVVEHPLDSRSRELTSPAAPVWTVDLQLTWLDENGDLWRSDPELREAAAIATGRDFQELGPWIDPGFVVVAYEADGQRLVRALELATGNLTPIGAWADTPGLHLNELRFDARTDTVLFRVGTKFFRVDRDGADAEQIAEGFSSISSWDW
ncbi:MAG: hypothetical protein H6739_26705 [Alphaproteobacteria bacterium]|nr:hypothetical protein [Alphaproteobacteria bacterium]